MPPRFRIFDLRDNGTCDLIEKHLLLSHNNLTKILGLIRREFLFTLDEGVPTSTSQSFVFIRRPNKNPI